MNSGTAGGRPLLLRAGRTLVGGSLVPGVDVLVRDGRVAAVGPDVAPPLDAEVREYADVILAPGFIDLHVHAMDGAGVLYAGRSDLPGLARALARRGVTGFLGTTATAPLADLQQILKVVAESADEGGARCLGVHLEGPWLSPDRPGAQPAQHIVPPTVEDLDRLVDAGPVAMVTIASEVAGALDVVRSAAARGIVVSLGHSAASYDEARQAVAAGARHVTHCFNAMSPLHHREPGLVGAALDSAEVTVEAIADGVHLHPAVVRLMWRARGPQGVCLVSDAVSGVLESAGDAPAVQLRDGRLAGSTVGLDSGVRNAVAWGVPVEDALTMASTTPADVLGRPDLGRIEVGATADLVLLDVALNVAATVVGGDVRYEVAR